MSRWWPRETFLRLGRPDGAPGTAGLEEAFEAFASRLDALAPAPGTRVRCLIAGRLARLLIVPWHGALAHAGQREPLARHCFSETFGSVAADWVVCVDPAPRSQPALACATEARLAPRLEELLASRRLRNGGMRALFAEAFNRARSEMRGADGWFVLCEPPRLTCLLLRQGRPHALRHLAGALGMLPRALDRESLCLGLERAPTRAWIVPVAEPLARVGDARWTLEWFEPLLDAADIATPGAAPGRRAA